MQVFNSFQEMAVGTGALGAQSTMSVFNAEFAGVADLTVEQRKQIQPYMDAVFGVEKTFRTADDVFMQEESRYKEELERVKRQLQPITSKRLAAANTFEKGKAILEAPLNEYGVSVIWDEPQVDATHIDLYA